MSAIAIGDNGSPGLSRTCCIHQFLLGGVQALHPNIPHELLPAFVDAELQVHAVGLLGRRRVPFEGRAGEAIGEVVGQDGIAIRGHAEFAERLSGGRTQVADDARKVELLLARDGQIRPPAIGRPHPR